MKSQKNQVIEWYNYWWTLKPIRGVTVTNILACEYGHLVGEWKDVGGTPHRIVKDSPSDEMWRIV